MSKFSTKQMVDWLCKNDATVRFRVVDGLHHMEMRIPVGNDVLTFEGIDFLDLALRARSSTFRHRMKAGGVF